LYSDPDDQPQAVEQAAQFDIKRISIDGARATIVFPHGEPWRLVRVRRAWRIAEFRILPPSVEDEPRSTTNN
jgi:hypothetical protein